MVWALLARNDANGKVSQLDERARTTSMPPKVEAAQSRGLAISAETSSLIVTLFET